MRSFRSFTKTKSAAPLSFFACPTPHFLNARTAKSSRVKFSGTLRSLHTRIWFDVSRSYCSSFEFNASARSADSAPALSVTYRAGLGGSCSSIERWARSVAAAAAKTRPTAAREPIRLIRDPRLPITDSRLSRRQRSCVPEVEIDGGRPLGSRGDRLEVRLFLEPEHRGEDVRRETQPRRVVILRGVVVAHPLDVDAVLRPLELGLEVTEVLVRFEFGIPFDHHEESLQRGAELGLRRFELSQLPGVGRRVRGVDLSPSDGRPGVDDGLQGALLEIRGSLDRRDEVRDEVRASLIRALDVTPLFVHVLAELDQAVVSSGHRDADDHGEDDEQGDASETEFPHGCLLLLVAGGFYKRGSVRRRRAGRGRRPGRALRGLRRLPASTRRGRRRPCAAGPRAGGRRRRGSR